MIQLLVSQVVEGSDDTNIFFAVSSSRRRRHIQDNKTSVERIISGSSFEFLRRTYHNDNARKFESSSFIVIGIWRRRSIDDRKAFEPGGMNGDHNTGSTGFAAFSFFARTGTTHVISTSRR
uniref:Uncharacterized protein n=1 Tax=Octactis speculum TaxID=3111310 RepID=A0A7S2H8F4_9STRA|mmetsp:Transcript_62353/g.85707  ORF Transcript_62353/g.85707 Transcript_62353/m.85707 type:complete len:121 (+) Transcript_62353:131-493(+)